MPSMSKMNGLWPKLIFTAARGCLFMPTVGYSLRFLTSRNATPDVPGVSIAVLFPNGSKEAFTVTTNRDIVLDW